MTEKRAGYRLAYSDTGDNVYVAPVNIYWHEF